MALAAKTITHTPPPNERRKDNSNCPLRAAAARFESFGNWPGTRPRVLPSFPAFVCLHKFYFQRQFQLNLSQFIRDDDARGLRWLIANQQKLD